MWRTFAAILLATSMLAAATGAWGMGGGGGMGGGMGGAGTNYGQSTLGDDVQHSPKPTHSAKSVKHKHKHVQKQ